MTRRSPSYEMRLAKYAHRGYSVLVPSLDMSRVDPQIYERRFDQLQGLARLLLLGTFLCCFFSEFSQNDWKVQRPEHAINRNNACVN